MKVRNVPNVLFVNQFSWTNTCHEYNISNIVKQRESETWLERTGYTFFAENYVLARTFWTCVLVGEFGQEENKVTKKPLN